MIFKSDTSGLDSLIARITEAKTALPFILVEATQSAGEAMAGKLGDAAPHGQGPSGSPPGDAPGSLADSFQVKGGSASGDEASISVITTQPTKLKYVTEGTGLYGPLKRLIVPVKAKALYWEGASHPVKSVKGQRPNPFVKPVLAKASDIVQPAMDKATEAFTAILGGQ